MNADFGVDKMLRALIASYIDTSFATDRVVLVTPLSKSALIANLEATGNGMRGSGANLVGAVRDDTIDIRLAHRSLLSVLTVPPVVFCGTMKETSEGLQIEGKVMQSLWHRGLHGLLSFAGLLMCLFVSMIVTYYIAMESPSMREVVSALIGVVVVLAMVLVGGAIAGGFAHATTKSARSELLAAIQEVLSARLVVLAKK